MPTPAVLRPLLSLPLVLLAAACAPSTVDGGSGSTDKPRGRSSEPRMCTEIGCMDQAHVTASLTSAGALTGTHSFEVTLDGVAQTCTLEFAKPDEHADATCSGGAELRLGPVMRGVEHQGDGVVGYSEEPVPGEWEWTLDLMGTPKTVHVVHKHGDAVLVDQTADFSYEDLRPNGEGCEPVCKGAKLAWKGP